MTAPGTFYETIKVVCDDSTFTPIVAF